MATVFAAPVNNCSTTVGTAYTSGAGSLVLATGGGAKFPTLTGGQYYRVTVCQVAFAYSPTATTANYTIYKATGKSTDTLTGLSVISTGLDAPGNTDRNYAVGDIVEVRVTAGTLGDIQVAVNTLENAGGGGDLMATLTNSISSITTTASPSVYDTMYNCSGTSSNYTVTLPAPTAGKLIGFKMDHGLTKLVTLSASSGNIDGATTRVMWANEVAVLLGDGSNWTKVAGKSISMYCKMYRNASFTIPYNATTDIPIDTTVASNPSSMADTGNGRINLLRPGSWNVFAAVQFIYSSTTSNILRTSCRSRANSSTIIALSAGLSPISGTTAPIPSELSDSVYYSSAGDYIVLSAYQAYIDLSSPPTCTCGGNNVSYIVASENISW